MLDSSADKGICFMDEEDLMVGLRRRFMCLFCLLFELWLGIEEFLPGILRTGLLVASCVEHFFGGWGDRVIGMLLRGGDFV